jgi:hypothetical protein
MVASYTNVATTGYQLWLDGALLVQGTAGSISTNADDKLRIGSNGAGDVGFNGLMDQILIYNRQLQPLEITNLYASGAGLFHNSTTNFNGLVGCFELDDSPGATTNFLDASTKATSLTSTGTLTKAVSTVAKNPSAALTNMVLQTIPIPSLYTPTNFRTVVWSSSTNINQQVSLDGTNWTPVVLYLSGTSGSGTSATNMMWYGSGSFTNALTTTNVYLRTLASSNFSVNALGQSISWK